MTIAVCFKCGATEWGAFTSCRECGALPASDDDLLKSLAFTDHLDHAALADIGRNIQAGRYSTIDPAMAEYLAPRGGADTEIGQPAVSPITFVSRLHLRAGLGQLALGAEDVAVEIGDPLPAA
jgi:hypothetical protein